MRPGFSPAIKGRKRRRIGQYAPSEPAIYEGWAIGVKLSAPGPLRQNTNFLSRINVIWVVQSHLQKYIGFRQTQISSKTPAIPSHSEGRFAIVTDVGRDAVDAGCATDERAGPADGEGVWS
jgi:hypothetical protein